MSLTAFRHVLTHLKSFTEILNGEMISLTACHSFHNKQVPMFVVEVRDKFCSVEGDQLSVEHLLKKCQLNVN